MKKAILIQCPINLENCNTYIGIPMGLAYIAAAAEKSNHSISIIDGNILTNYNEFTDLIFSNITKISPDIVGFTANIHTYQQVLYLSKSIKKFDKNIKIAIGGHHATFTAEETLKNNKSVDIIVLGEGEKTFVELLNSDFIKLSKIKGLMYRTENNAIRFTGIRKSLINLDMIPFPALHLLPHPKNYTKDNMREKGTSMSVITSRGCPYNCSFCSISAFYSSFGMKYRERSIKNILDECNSFIPKYEINYIKFIDDNFFLKPQRVYKLVLQLNRRYPEIRFGFVSRADGIIKGRDIIYTLYELGCRMIEVGIENGSNSVLKRMNKQSSVDMNIEAINIIRKSKINLVIDYILFEPYMDLFELDENIEFLKKINIFIDPSIVCNKIIPFPGTPIYRKLKKENKLRNYPYMAKKLDELNYQYVFNYEFENDKIDFIWNKIILFRDKTIKKFYECKQIIEKLLKNKYFKNKPQVLLNYKIISILYLDFLIFLRRGLDNHEIYEKEFEILIHQKLDEINELLDNILLENGFLSNSIEVE